MQCSKKFIDHCDLNIKLLVFSSMLAITATSRTTMQHGTQLQIPPPALSSTETGGGQQWSGKKRKIEDGCRKILICTNAAASFS